MVSPGSRMSQGRRSTKTPEAFPERIGRHEILLPIARGGMGAVYLARTRGAGGFEREVALKLLHRSDGGRYALELVEEAKLASLIRHPNVVQVFDVEEGPLGVFMTMEYIEGPSLGGLLRAANAEGARLPQGIGLRILLDALAGLSAAHELEGSDGRPLGLVHRDFSPQNILVGCDGISKLADFGIAKAANRAGHTATGTIKGKLAYMAPEQLGGAPLDRRCDVWAAGVVAWEILAGRRMHEIDDDIALMYRIAHDQAPRLRAVGVEVPVALDEAIARALARDPAARCPTAAALARTVEVAGVEPAAPDEVAAYVRRLLGAELTARRARIAELLERRREAPGDLLDEAPVPPRASTRSRLAAVIAAALVVASGAWTMRWPASASPRSALSSADPGSPIEGRDAPDPTATSRAPAVLDASLPLALSLQLNADAPIASLSIGGQPIPVSPPSPRLMVAAPAGIVRPARLEATSSDGRRVVLSLGDGISELTIHFPAVPAKASPKRSARQLPLAPSPYGRSP